MQLVLPFIIFVSAKHSTFKRHLWKSVDSIGSINQLVMLGHSSATLIVNVCSVVHLSLIDNVNHSHRQQLGFFILV